MGIQIDRRRAVRAVPQGELADRARSEQHLDRFRAAGGAAVHLRFRHQPRCQPGSAGRGRGRQRCRGAAVCRCARRLSLYRCRCATPRASACARLLAAGEVRGMVVICVRFSSKVRQGEGSAAIQVLTDGAEPNTANFLGSYLQGVWQVWLQGARDRPGLRRTRRSWNSTSALLVQSTTVSRNYLVPGSISVDHDHHRRPADVAGGGARVGSAARWRPCCRRR